MGIGIALTFMMTTAASCGEATVAKSCFSDGENNSGDGLKEREIER